MKKTGSFESSVQGWLAPAGGAGEGSFGISYWRANRPTRLFRSREEMERIRLAFVRANAKKLNLIRLARETKYYVGGKNVPNRL